MADNDYPRQVSDPESEGLPGTADDDSTAFDDVNGGRWADGQDPAALPSDRPLAVDRFGTTPQEQRSGEPLNDRLAQEEPDTPFDEPGRARLAADVYGESPVSDPHSPVSIYDSGQLDEVASTPVGRLVAPDEGYGDDQEADSVAYDAGASGGGATAEELAIHESRSPEFR